MSTYLFLVFPSPSHYFASFPFAETLKKDNDSVVFTGSLNDRNRILNQGFDFLEIDYLTETVVKSLPAFLALLIKSLLDKKELIGRYRHWRREVTINIGLLESVKPSKVFIDEHLWYYLPIVHSFCSDIEMINTKLSTKKSKGFPPLSSSFIPRGNWLSDLICELIWIWHHVIMGLKELPKKISLLNRTEDYFLRRFSRKNGLVFSTIFSNKNSFYKGVECATINILVNPKLELPTKALKANERFADFPINRNEMELESERVKDFLNSLSKDQSSRKPIVLCSFGTQTIFFQNKLNRFFDKLHRVIEIEQNLLFIVVSEIEISFMKLPNLILFKKIPQLKFLEICDVMISHGGLTTIRECFQLNVPVLVYPLNSSTDQNGNSSRVVVNKLGLRGSIRFDSSDDIRRKINKLLSWRA